MGSVRTIPLDQAGGFQPLPLFVSGEAVFQGHDHGQPSPREEGAGVGGNLPLAALPLHQLGHGGGELPGATPITPRRLRTRERRGRAMTQIRRNWAR